LVDLSFRRILSTTGISIFPPNTVDQLAIEDHFKVTQGGTPADVLWKLVAQQTGHQTQHVNHKDSPLHSDISPTATSLKGSNGYMDTSNG